jgi:hypothetical protein
MELQWPVAMQLRSQAFCGYAVGIRGGVQGEGGGDGEKNWEEGWLRGRGGEMVEMNEGGTG